MQGIADDHVWEFRSAPPREFRPRSTPQAQTPKKTIEDYQNEEDDNDDDF